MQTTRFVLAALVKDLRRLAADPAALAIALGVPLVLGGLMHLAMGGSDGPAPKAHLLVADEDDSFVSGLLTGALGSEQAASFLAVEHVSRERGLERMEAGEASALLVLPAGFGQALLLDEPQELELVTNPAQTILPGIVEGALGMLVDGSFYAQRLVGDTVRDLLVEPEGGAPVHSDVLVADVSVRINHVIEQLAGILFPPVLDVEVDFASEAGSEEGAPARSLGALLFPGVLIMSLLFLASSLGGDLWIERDAGTLRRLLTTPRSIGIFLVAKVCSGTMVAIAISAVALVLGCAVFGLPWSRLPSALAWCSLAGACFLALLSWLQSLASSSRAANVLATIVIFPAMMLGGSFFPLDAMPGWMRAVGTWTPNGMAVEQLAVLLGGESPGMRLLVAAGALLALTAVALAATSIRLQRSFSRG